MRKLIAALVLTVAACLWVAATAGADTGPIQVSGQSAGTSQGAVAASGATQTNPTNTNVSIRVLSPGNDGNVTQSNTAASSATAGNAAATNQSSGQNAGGAGGIQTSQQAAGTEQLGIALSAAQQSNPTNVNVPIRVLSEGNDGNVTQSNNAVSTGTAANSAGTTQSSTQNQGGSPCGCGYPEPVAAPAPSTTPCGCGDSSSPIQTSEQSAGTHQSAGALSKAEQTNPSNTNVSVRVLSPGNGGNVTQSNTAASAATAGNTAATTQSSTQNAGASKCSCGASPVQQAKQAAGTGQEAGALSVADQVHPSNTSSPVRVGSLGNDGSVDQSNTAASAANAANKADTTQTATQAAAGNGIEIAGQDAGTKQGALAASLAHQAGASNDASPVRVDSPGGGGSVKQSNDAASAANAGNAASTNQTDTQTVAGAPCGCNGLGIQVLGQQSGTQQAAIALSAAVQDFGKGRSPCGCGGSGAGNTASPVRVGSFGNDGDVTQSNTAASAANAGNSASTKQDGTQTEAGGGLQIQALGQRAWTGQEGLAASFAGQFAPKNDASPVRVESPGGGGSVSQSNAALSAATGANAATTTQSGRQSIGAVPCDCRDHSLPIQVAGQDAHTSQAIAALSAALQWLPSNNASPTRVKSPNESSPYPKADDGYGSAPYPTKVDGLGGSTKQDNTGASAGTAGNRSETGQGVGQGS
jgi:hypothetical protein